MKKECSGEAVCADKDSTKTCSKGEACCKNKMTLENASRE
jgi:hypothetical protein